MHEIVEVLDTDDPQQAEERHLQNQIQNDSVSIIAKHSQIPVGGRLTLFLSEWKKIT